MKNHFISVNNIEKAIAFAPSLDSKYRERIQLTKTKKDYLETIDIIQALAKEGWEVEGVCESRGSNRIINSQYVKLFNPDISLMNGKTMEGKTNIILTNSIDGIKPAEIDFGVWRKVCSNGLIRRVSGFDTKIKHGVNAFTQMQKILSQINTQTSLNIKKFGSFKERLLTSSEMKELANEAIGLRWKDGSVTSDQLLNINRSEDSGNNLWLVYNRIQENLTKSGMLRNLRGNSVEGIRSLREDIFVNKELSALAESLI